MKTIFIRYLFVAGVALLITSSSQAQIGISRQARYGESTDAVNMNYLKVDLSALKNYVGNDNASRRIMKYFVKHFENVENIGWQNVEENVLARFVHDGAKTSALFDKNGKLVYTISYSDERSLPRYYRQMVNNSYKGFVVDQVAKINEALREVWVVKLESPDRFISVQIEDDQPQEVENFKKSR